jgi:hypothetical protein
MQDKSDRDRILQSTAETKVYSASNNPILTDHFLQGKRRLKEWAAVGVNRDRAVEIARGLNAMLGSDTVAVMFEDGLDDSTTGEPLWAELLIRPDRLDDVRARIGEIEGVGAGTLARLAEIS